MKGNNIQMLLGASAIACLVCITGQAAHAGSFHNGWNYGIDAFNDGSGGSNYEIKGMAIKDTADSVFVALTGGTPLEGISDNRAMGKSIGWGDLFLNFSGKNFSTALADGDIYGVRFAAESDSDLETGVYQVDSLAAIGKQNRGYNNLKKYYNKFPHATLGTDLPTPTDTYTYLYGSDVASNPTENNTPLLNMIDSGTRQGGIELLDFTQLTGEGLDFTGVDGGMLGPETFGFRFDRSLLGDSEGDFIAHLFLECGNDSVALAGSFWQKTPEPSGLAGLAVMGGLAAAGLKQRQRRRQDNQNEE